MSADKKVRPYQAAVNAQQQEEPKTPAEIIMNTSSDADDDDEILIEVNMNSTKAKWIDNYKLQSYYIHLDLLKLFDKTTKKMGKGAKTLLTNEGLKYILVDKPRIDKEKKRLANEEKKGTSAH